MHILTPHKEIGVRFGTTNAFCWAIKKYPKQYNLLLQKWRWYCGAWK